MKQVDELDAKLIKKFKESEYEKYHNKNQNEDKKDDNSSSEQNNSNELDYSVPDNHGYLLLKNNNDSKYTLFCQYPPETKESKTIDKLNTYLFPIDNNPNSLKDFCLLYKAYKNVPDCITLPMINSGVIRTTSYLKANLIWKLLKTDKMDTLIQKLNRHQRYNHFPCTWQIGRKDNLWRNFLPFSQKYPNDFNYLPKTFLLPESLSEVEKEVLPIVKNITQSSRQAFILKPVASSRGRGIKLLTPATSIPKKCLISQYIDNPHIINKKKYDLRLYIVITNFSPLKIYLYEEGLVRFASEDYDSDNLYNKFMHLTNYSINKESSQFDKNISSQNECIGSKWSLNALRSYFINNNLNFEELWTKIKDVIVKTCITIEKQTCDKINTLTNYDNSMFELYGFDILVDSNFRPWLMEVNLNPSLNTDTDLDLKVKSMLMTDIFTLIGIEPYSHLNDKNANKKGGAKNIECFADKLDALKTTPFTKKIINKDSLSAGTQYGVFSQDTTYSLTLKEDYDSNEKERKEADNLNDGKYINIYIYNNNRLCKIFISRIQKKRNVPTVIPFKVKYRLLLSVHKQ